MESVRKTARPRPVGTASAYQIDPATGSLHPEPKLSELRTGVRANSYAFGACFRGRESETLLHSAGSKGGTGGRYHGKLAFTNAYQAVPGCREQSWTKYVHDIAPVLNPGSMESNRTTEACTL